MGAKREAAGAGVAEGGSGWRVKADGGWQRGGLAGEIFQRSGRWTLSTDRTTPIFLWTEDGPNHADFFSSSLKLQNFRVISANIYITALFYFIFRQITKLRGNLEQIITCLCFAFFLPCLRNYGAVDEYIPTYLFFI